jgi:hypothetical protein
MVEDVPASYTYIHTYIRTYSIPPCDTTPWVWRCREVGTLGILVLDAKGHRQLRLQVKSGQSSSSSGGWEPLASGGLGGRGWWREPVTTKLMQNLHRQTRTAAAQTKKIGRERETETIITHPPIQPPPHNLTKGETPRPKDIFIAFNTIRSLSI